MKKIFMIILAVFCLMMFGGCKEDKPLNEIPKDDTPIIDQTTDETPEVKITTLKGKWRGEKDPEFKQSIGEYFEAIITEDTIEILWTTNGGNSFYTYWIGNYEDPKEAVSTYSWVSYLDYDKVSDENVKFDFGYSIPDSEKIFSYENGKINFWHSNINHNYGIIHLEKVED